MVSLNVTSITFAELTSKYDQDIKLQIKFDCLKEIKREVEWKIIYVADPENKEKDILLDNIVMDSIETGINEFEWVVSPPDLKSNAFNDKSILDSTIMIITISILGLEFFRCSFLVRHFNEGEDIDINNNDNEIENNKQTVIWDKLMREFKETPMLTLHEEAWEEIEKAGNNGNISNEELKDKFKDFDLLGDNNASNLNLEQDLRSKALRELIN